MTAATQRTVTTDDFKYRLFAQAWASPKGRTKLRDSVKHPILNRLRFLSTPDVAEQWEILPPKVFWAAVRAEAHRTGMRLMDAFIYLADTPVELDRLPCTPHPLLQLR